MTTDGPPWRVKYDGRCAACARPLAKGEPAIWDRGNRTMRCLACPQPIVTKPTPAPPVVDVGVAGSSTRREYERRMAKREAAVRGRWGDRLGGVVLALTVEPQSTRAWALGSLGEQKLAASISGLADVIALHDRRVRGTRGNIDHLVIAPSGVFVIDAKRLRGQVHTRWTGPIWRQELRLYAGGRDISALADGLKWQAEAVKAALIDDRIGTPPPVTSVLCFVDAEWPLIGVARSFRAVAIDRPKTLPARFSGPAGYTPDEVVVVAQILAAAFPAK